MTASNYPACMAFTRRQEGGNTDVRGDRGGRTGRGGITHSTYDSYRHRRGLPLQDVFKISDAEISDIYRGEYWTPVQGDSLPVGVDLCLFDISINSGPVRAEHILHAVGPIESPANLVHAVCAERLRFLKGLSSWGRFGRGWSRRVSECEARAMDMVATIDPAAKAHIEKTKAAKEVKKSNTRAGGAVVVGGAVAGLHGFAGMPGHMALVAGLALLAFVGYSVFKARRAMQKLTPIKAAAVIVAKPLGPPVSVPTPLIPIPPVPTHLALTEAELAHVAEDVIKRLDEKLTEQLKQIEGKVS
jgi:lysozyme family protein